MSKHLNVCSVRYLIDQLNEYTKLYNAGTPAISDKEWDELYFKLVEAEKETGIIYPDSPTQAIVAEDVDALKKVKHNHPMLSLDKTKDIEVFKRFIGDKDYILMAKMDGLTCSLKYIDGKLVSAETRGNGIEGEDILHNMNYVKEVPLQIPILDELVVDGEIVCDLKTFEENFKNDYKNPRNYAAGAIRRLHASENKNCGLTFVAWDCIKGIDEDTLTKKLFKLIDIGFRVVPFIRKDFITEEYSTLESQIRLLRDSYSEAFPIDGVVAKYDNCAYYESLGHTDHHFRGGFAFKFYDEEYETRLKDIDYDVSRNGVLTPVAVFEPVDIDGSTVSRASLHNMSVMYKVLGDTPYYGERIWIIKSNQIIPQIVKADIRDYGDIVSHGGVTVGFGGDYGVLCPVCGGLTSINKSESGVEVLVCDNENCPGKLAQRIDHYCSKKGMDIKGLSRKTIEKLIDWGWINDNISELYDLQSHRAEWINKSGFGTASVDKILDAIERSKKNADLGKFISGLGIPLVGQTIAREITKYCSTWDDFKDMVGGDWTIFDGFGTEISREINDFDYSEADKIAAILDFSLPETKVESGQETVAPAIQDKTFCITGKLKTFKNRDELKSDIVSLGGKVTDSISSKTDYLINNDINSTSSKNNKAKQLGIPIISEEDYINLKNKQN